MAHTSLDYAALHETLAGAGAVVALPELHGGVCGALCAGAIPAARRWVLDLLQDQELEPSIDLGAVLDDLIARSLQTLEERELGFAPLLPSDDEPLADRVQGLALWCHGFAGALGANAPEVAIRGHAEGEGAATIAEILADFAEISRAGLSDAEAEGEDAPDFALAELMEYVRVSVQIVFEELGPRRVAAASPSH
jgi:uncharacterized protein YgfB (UPF0149 family)